MGRWLWNKLTLWAGIASFSTAVLLIDIVTVPPSCKLSNGWSNLVYEEINETYRRLYLPDHWVDFPGQDWPIERRYEYLKADLHPTYERLVFEARLWDLMGVPEGHPARRKHSPRDMIKGYDSHCRLINEVATKGGRFEHSLPPGSFYRVDDEGNIIPQTEPLVPLFE